MIKALAKLFTTPAGDHDQSCAPSAREMHLLSAAIMAEVMVSDGTSDSREIAGLERILADDFHLDPDDTADVINQATRKVEDATSLFEFTDRVNRHFSDAQKLELVGHLWEVAYADREVHKLEEATIRKIADLIHVRHRDFIRAKHLARPGD